VNLQSHFCLSVASALKEFGAFGTGLARCIRGVRAAAAILILSVLAPLALAQDSRGPILVINDWNDVSEVTLLMERHEELIKNSWSIAPGNRSYLTMVEGGRNVRVSARDRIKVRSDSRAVAIGDVGRFRDGEWHVRVRDVFQAQKGRDGRTSQQAPIGASSPSQYEFNTDRGGSDYSDFELRSADPALCAQACQADSNCRAWTYGHPNKVGKGHRAHCWLKSAAPEPTPNNCCVSGVN
jgi:hypothetical protein